MSTNKPVKSSLPDATGPNNPGSTTSPRRRSLPARCLAAVKLLVKYVKRIRLASTLPAQYAALGKQAYVDAPYREEYGPQYQTCDGLFAQLGVLEAVSATRPKAAGFVARVISIPAAAWTTLRTNLRKSKLNRSFRSLGKAAFEKHGDQIGPQELVAPIKTSTTRLEALKAEIAELSKSEGQILTPRRLAIGGVCFACLVVMLFATAVVQGRRTVQLLAAANALWESDKKGEAVAAYRSLIATHQGRLAESARSLVFRRVVEFDADQGNSGEAKRLIQEARDGGIVLSLESPKAQELLAQVQAEEVAKRSLVNAGTQGDQRPASPFAEATAASEKEPNKDVTKDIGDLQSLGEAFYANLDFAHIDDGQSMDGITLSTEFCPDGRRTYRTVTYAFEKETMTPAERDQMTAMGETFPDRVSDITKTELFKITPGEPKSIYSAGDASFLPLLKLNASPGDSWEWHTSPLIHRFKYVKALRYQDYQCALITEEEYVDNGSHTLAGRTETWYVKGIGPVKRDEQQRIGNKLVHFATAHIVGKSSDEETSDRPQGIAVTGATATKPGGNSGFPGGPAREFAVDLGNGIKLVMILIPAGEFMMGSPDSDKDASDFQKPQHRVRITKPFYLGKYLVMQEQWDAVMHDNPSHFKGPKNPVEQVSWEDCQQFLSGLNAKLHPGEGKFQLPTEAQWEYACRAGSTTRYCFGDDESGLGEYAWYRANSGGKLHPVGEKKPNAWKLYDMHGSLFEWCKEEYQDGYYAESPVNDPQGLDGLASHVIRGGSWNDVAGYCCSAFRSYGHPGFHGDGLGFRVSQVLTDGVRANGVAGAKDKGRFVGTREEFIAKLRDMGAQIGNRFPDKRGLTQMVMITMKVATWTEYFGEPHSVRQHYDSFTRTTYDTWIVSCTDGDVTVLGDIKKLRSRQMLQVRKVVLK